MQQTLGLPHLGGRTEHSVPDVVVTGYPLPVQHTAKGVVTEGIAVGPTPVHGALPLLLEDSEPQPVLVREQELLLSQVEPVWFAGINQFFRSNIDIIFLSGGCILLVFTKEVTILRLLTF